MVCALLLLAAVLSMWDIVNETARRGGYTPQDRPLVSRAPEYVMAGSDYTDFKRMIYLSDEEKVEVQDYILETSKATVWLVCREEGQYIEAPMFHYPGYGNRQQQPGQGSPFSVFGGTGDYGAVYGRGYFPGRLWHYAGSSDMGGCLL